MKPVSKDILKDAALRLLFDMSNDQYDTLLAEFSILSEQMKKIGLIEGVDDEEPMTFPFECTTDFLREDEPITPLPRDVALGNAHSKQDDQIKLPKVVL